MAGIKPPQGLFQFKEVAVFPWDRPPQVITIEKIVEQRIEVPVEVIRTVEVPKIVTQVSAHTQSKIKSLEAENQRLRDQVMRMPQRAASAHAPGLVAVPIPAPIILMTPKMKLLWALVGSAVGLAIGWLL